MNWRTIAVGTAIAASVPIFQAIITLDVTQITDLHSWAVGVATGSVRQAAIYFTATAIPWIKKQYSVPTE